VAAPGRLSSGERKKKGKGRGEADRRGRHVSGSRKNKKGTTGLGRCGRELVGRQAEGRKGFSFFSNSFQNNFSFQIQTKIVLNFSQNFIILLEATQATKNHANQMMMHNHLLSL
jgi:hypothetical protein